MNGKREEGGQDRRERETWIGGAFVGEHDRPVAAGETPAT